MKGVPLSAEHRAKISAAKKGVPRPDLAGVEKSDAHRAKLSAAQKGIARPAKVQPTEDNIG